MSKKTYKDIMPNYQGSPIYTADLQDDTDYVDENGEWIISENPPEGKKTLYIGEITHQIRNNNMWSVLINDNSRDLPIREDTSHPGIQIPRQHLIVSHGKIYMLPPSLQVYSQTIEADGKYNSNSVVDKYFNNSSDNDVNQGWALNDHLCNLLQGYTIYSTGFGQNNRWVGYIPKYDMPCNDDIQYKPEKNGIGEAIYVSQGFSYENDKQHRYYAYCTTFQGNKGKQWLEKQISDGIINYYMEFLQTDAQTNEQESADVPAFFVGYQGHILFITEHKQGKNRIFNYYNKGTKKDTTLQTTSITVNNKEYIYSLLEDIDVIKALQECFETDFTSPTSGEKSITEVISSVISMKDFGMNICILQQSSTTSNTIINGTTYIKEVNTKDNENWDEHYYGIGYFAEDNHNFGYLYEGEPKTQQIQFLLPKNSLIQDNQYRSLKRIDSIKPYGTVIGLSERTSYVNLYDPLVHGISIVFSQASQNTDDNGKELAYTSTISMFCSGANFDIHKVSNFTRDNNNNISAVENDEIVASCIVPTTGGSETNATGYTETDYRENLGKGVDHLTKWYLKTEGLTIYEYRFTEEASAEILAGIGITLDNNVKYYPLNYHWNKGDDNYIDISLMRKALFEDNDNNLYHEYRAAGFFVNTTVIEGANSCLNKNIVGTNGSRIALMPCSNFYSDYKDVLDEVYSIDWNNPSDTAQKQNIPSHGYGINNQPTNLRDIDTSKNTYYKVPYTFTDPYHVKADGNVIELDGYFYIRVPKREKQASGTVDPIVIDDKQVAVSSGAFPEGLSSKYFNIIAHSDYNSNDLFKSNDIVNKLNKWGKDYITNRSNYSDASSSSLSASDNFYGKDSNGIYIYVNKKSLDDSISTEDNTNINNETVVVGSQNCYKIYIKGTCELSAITTDNASLGQLPTEKGNTQDAALTIPNGYYLRFGEGTPSNPYSYYMFIVTKIGLLKYDTALVNANYDVAKGSSYTTGYTDVDNTTHSLHSHYDAIVNDRNYIFKGEAVSNDDIKSLPTETDPNAKFYLSSDPIIKTVIVADNVSEINYFWGNANPNNMIINAKVIGDYSFYGCNLSSDIITSNSLEKIGKYAFANTTNLSLKSGSSNIFKFGTNLTDIDNRAFYQSGGFSGVDFTQMPSISLGTQVFAGCANLRTAKYKVGQVPYLYLPPDEGAGNNYAVRTAGTSGTVTTSYRYDYTAATADPIATSEATNSKETFKDCTNMTFTCVS